MVLPNMPAIVKVFEIPAFCVSLTASATRPAIVVRDVLEQPVDGVFHIGALTESIATTGHHRAGVAH